MEGKRMRNYLRLAKKVSVNSDHRYQVGAVLVKGKTPMSICCNRAKTHPVYANPTGSIHAEMRCLIHAKRHSVKDSTIYVWRSHKNGTPALSRPCSTCLELLREAGVSKIVYSIDERPYYAEEFI